MLKNSLMLFSGPRLGGLERQLCSVLVLISKCFARILSYRPVRQRLFQQTDKLSVTLMAAASGTAAFLTTVELLSWSTASGIAPLLTLAPAASSSCASFSVWVSHVFASLI